MSLKSPPFTLFLALFSSLFFVIANYSLTLMAGIYIVGELGGSNYITTYTIIFYTLGNALGIPLGRPLSGKIGYAKLFFLCMMFFAFFSFLCSQAANYPIFIVLRFMQGYVAGPLYYLIMHFFNLLAPKEKKSSYTIVTLTIYTVAPVVGASFGGWIAYDYHWQWLFYFNLPFIIFLGCYVAFELKKYQLTCKCDQFDGIGYFFYFISIFCLTFVIATGQEFDWFRSFLLNTLSAIGVPCFIFFILWSLHHPNPIIHFRLFLCPLFSLGLFNLAILFGVYFGTIILLALWLNLYVDYTPIWIAVLIGTMAIAGILPSFLMGKEYGKSDSRVPLFLGIALFAISSFHTSIFDVEINFGRIAFSRILAGFGLAFFLPPIFRMCFRSFSEERNTDVLVAFQFVRALSSGLGAAIFTILWQRRQIFYHERLGSKLTVFSQQTNTFFSKAKQFYLSGLPADMQLDIFLDRQATALALDDCFYLMGWLMVALIIILAITLIFRKEHFIPERLWIKQ